MNRNELLSQFSMYDDEKLLHALAFDAGSYTDEAKSVILSICLSRGYSEGDVTKYRRENLRLKEAAVVCDSCGSTVTLESSDLYAGEYHCPECNSQQTLHYQSSWIRSEPEPGAQSRKRIALPSNTSPFPQLHSATPLNRELLGRLSALEDDEVVPQVASVDTMVQIHRPASLILFLTSLRFRK